MVRWYSSLVGRIFYFRMPVPNAGRTSSFTDHISLFRTLPLGRVESMLPSLYALAMFLER